MGWVLVAVGLLAIIGCFGPWAKVSANVPLFGSINVSVNGIGGTSDNLPPSAKSSSSESSPTDSEAIKDGWYVIVAAAVVVGLGVARALGKIKKPIMWVAAAMSAIVAGIGIYDWSDIRDKAGQMKDQMAANGDSSVSVSAGSGWGLYLVLIMGLVMLGASIVSALRD